MISANGDCATEYFAALNLSSMGGEGYNSLPWALVKMDPVKNDENDRDTGTSFIGSCFTTILQKGSLMSFLYNSSRGFTVTGGGTGKETGMGSANGTIYAGELGYCKWCVARLFPSIRPHGGMTTEENMGEFMIHGVFLRHDTIGYR